MSDTRSGNNGSVSLKIMKVHDISKNKTPIYDVYFTLAPLNFILRLFGLCCITRDGKKLKYLWPVWKIIFMIILFFILTSSNFYFSLQTCKGTSIKFEDYIPIIYLFGFIQFIVDITFVYKYGRQQCLYYYSIFEHIDQILGMPYYKEIRSSVVKMRYFFIFIGFFTVLSEFLALSISYGWFVGILFGINHTYTAVKMLTALDGIAQFTQLKYRLRRIENILEDYYNNVENLSDVGKDIIRNKNGIKSVDKHLYLVSTIEHNRTNVFLHLNRCYLLLLEQCDYLNNMFGFRILCGTLLYLMEMVMLINLVIRLITGALIPLNGSANFLVISTTMRILNSSLVVLCEINRCEQNYKQVERIVRWVDHLLTNKKITIEAEETLKELKSLIITRPVNFNAMNFYRIDYPALLSMASAIVTYTIILLQNMK